MDSLTHLVAGALTPLAFPHMPKRAAILGFGIAVGELPDMDVLFGVSPEALLMLHRGITHSLIWQPVLALVAVLPFFIWMQCKSISDAGPCRGPCAAPGERGPGLASMYLMALFALYTHIYLDCMTTFGTQIFLPFSDIRVGFPAMFIVDLLLTVPALILLIKAWRQQAVPLEPAIGHTLPGRPGYAVFPAGTRKLARIGLAWILLYPLAALGINTALTASANATAEDGVTTFLTEPFSPLMWKRVDDLGDSYAVSTRNLLGLEDASAVVRYAKPDPELYSRLKEQLPLFAHFEHFSAYMVQTERPPSAYAPAGKGKAAREYSFVDVRYIMASGSAALWLGRSDPNFVLEARVDSDNRLLAYRFLQRGKDAQHHPWVELP